MYVYCFPLSQVCPALAMGNTVILKPASYTRLTALLFAEICAEAGLPPGQSIYHKSPKVSCQCTCSSVTRIYLHMMKYENVTTPPVSSADPTLCEEKGPD